MMLNGLVVVVVVEAGESRRISRLFNGCFDVFSADTMADWWCYRLGYGRQHVDVWLMVEIEEKREERWRQQPRMVAMRVASILTFFFLRNRWTMGKGFVY